MRRIRPIHAVRIVLPAILSVALFVITIFVVILPQMEGHMMNGKREMIRELTETVVSALEGLQQQVEKGDMALEKAREEAGILLRSLRYGRDRKDYFWVNDMHPRLIVHPYRRDLEGEDISLYADPEGKRLFVAFVDVVKASGEGFVDYRWQWKDDPARVVPKISFVKGFAPWGWVVGTGIYVEDVRAEIAAITRNVTYLCLWIFLAMAGICAYIIHRGVAAEKNRMAADAEAARHQEQLFQADKLATLGTLVSGVAHEINNPVMFVMLNAPILKTIWQEILPVLDTHGGKTPDFHIGSMDYETLRERVPALLTNIEEGAKRIKAIVTDLKDYARMEPARPGEWVDVNDALARSMGLLGSLVRKSTSRLQVEKAPDLPAVRGNLQRIEQVIVNLVVNACQALESPEKAIVIRTFAEKDHSAVILEVADEGAGMTWELLQRIRDPFFTTKRQEGGTGLGLAISDRIVRDHGGTLNFTSAPGKGTTVRVRLPVSEPGPEWEGGPT